MRSKGVALSFVLSFVLSFLAVGVAGCGSKGGGAVTTDAGNDVRQDVGQDKPPLMVPDHWDRPADCKGVGQTCDLGCSPGAICQLDGYVCIPKAPGANDPPAERPYCLAYSCMTYEQASCFCTGPAGAMYPSCKDGPAAVAGLCAGEDSSCSDKACCNGRDCISLGPTTKVCYDKCSGNTDCDTNCCTDRRDTGDLVCAPLTSCQTPCKKRGQACTSYKDCCNGVCVMDANPDWNGCRPGCTSNADCDTGCCQLFANSSDGFCTDPGYCGCGAGCPAGSSCTTFDGKTLSCRKDCTDDDQCSSVCCSGNITGTNHGVCITKECTCVGGCVLGQSTCGSADNGATFQCLKNCMSPADCPTGCCSTFIPGKNYGSCLPASSCGM